MFCDLTSGVLPSPSDTEGVASVTGRNSRYLSITPRNVVNESITPVQAELIPATNKLKNLMNVRRMLQPAEGCPD